MVIWYNTSMTVFKSDQEADMHNAHWIGPARSGPEVILEEGNYVELNKVMAEAEQPSMAKVYFTREEKGKENPDRLIAHIRDGTGSPKPGESNAEYFHRQNRGYRAGTRRAEEQTYKLMRKTWTDLDPLRREIEHQLRAGRVRFEYQKEGSDLSRALLDTVLAVSSYLRPTDLPEEEQKRLDAKLAEELDKLAASTDSSDHEKMRRLITFAHANTEARRLHWSEKYERLIKRLAGAGIIEHS